VERDDKVRSEYVSYTATLPSFLALNSYFSFLPSLHKLTKEVSMGVVQLALPTENKVSYSYRVLVIEDNDACAKTMMWIMESLGHTAQIALDGHSAIELGTVNKPQV
jgi:hypothetical protein